MTRRSVGGLQVNTFTKTQLLAELQIRLEQRRKTFVVTLYSEFLYAALRQRQIMSLLNSATISVADGIGILWADYFLQMPFRRRSFLGRLLEAWWQVVNSGAAILLRPKRLYKVFPEKIVGADLVWDLSQLAAERNLSVYLLGGFDETPSTAALALRRRFPRLRIAGTSSKNPDDPSIMSDLEQAKPDILLVAYGPLKQESWITKYFTRLPATIVIGLGGTFDYLAGVQKTPPRFIRASGLEWLYRLVTQPHRLRRIMNATGGLVLTVARYKIFSSMPFRRNIVAVIFNRDRKVLVAQRNMRVHRAKLFGSDPNRLHDYWQFPQGGLQPDESLTEGAQREAKEEMGIDELVSLTVSDHTYSYEWNNASRPLLSWYHYRGQQQFVAYFMYSGSDTAVRVDNVEFTDYKWINVDDLIRTVHPERRPVAEIVLQDIKSGKVPLT